MSPVLKHAWQYRQHDNDHDGKGEIVTYYRKIPEEVTQISQQQYPQHRTRDIEEKKAPVAQLTDAGNEWRISAHDRNKARNYNCLAAVAFEEFLVYSR